ncbi:MAG: alpha-amylase family glycosyl hydrolase [Spirochaetales bacterium]
MKTLRTLGILFLVLAPFALSAQSAIKPVTKAEIPKLLQVPSPDWRDQIVYFVMTDRFFDGNTANSDQKKGEYDPTTNAKFSGGDLAGVTQKLDYIKGLGATSLWITPPVANQWWSPMDQYGGYHGYWAENFKEVDKHLGSLADYQLLSATLHKNGMYLIQDIVANHTGNFFKFDNPGDTDDPTNPKWQPTVNTGSVPILKPTQKPFDQNDFTKAADRKADIYHWTPEIRNPNNKTEMQNYQLSSLDDLNTENPVVINALIDSYNYWIKNVGVDAFRIDTVKYVPHDFWNVFHYNEDKKYPGIIPYAASLGKKDFFTFGEDYESSSPYGEKVDKTMASYLGTPDFPELKSSINYSLYWDLRDVFQKGRPTDQLTARFKSQYKAFKDPSLLINFIDNHDNSRFLASADKTSMQQALAFLYTIPGIPVVYYGTEQDFTDTRASMFAKGFGSGGTDHFDASSPTYAYLKALADLRTSEKEFSHGKLQVVRDSGGAGVFAYTTTYNGRTALVAINTASNTMVLDNGVTGLKEGAVLKRLFGLNDDLSGDDAVLAGTSRYDTLTIGAGGIVNAVLAPRSVVVLAINAAVDPAVAKLAPAIAPFPAVGAPVITGLADKNLVVKLDAQKLPVFPGNVDLVGTVPAVSGPRLLVNGNLASASPVTVNADGTWKGTLPVISFDNGTYNVVIQGRTKDGSLYLSSPYRFSVVLAYTSRATYDDPVGDDHGPGGAYKYPKHDSFTNQNDIKGVEVLTAGSNLQVKITMASALTTSWQGPNGFDHVHFYLYLNVPGVTPTSDLLPTQNGKTPSGFVWNRKAFFGGWDNALFSANSASMAANGAGASPAGNITLDRAKNQVLYTMSGVGLGGPKTLSGLQLYLTTWDYDGLESANRKMTPEGGDYIYIGPTGGPLVMDDTAVITLP